MIILTSTQQIYHKSSSCISSFPNTAVLLMYLYNACINSDETRSTAHRSQYLLICATNPPKNQRTARLIFNRAYTFISQSHFFPLV